MAAEAAIDDVLNFWINHPQADVNSEADLARAYPHTAMTLAYMRSVISRVPPATRRSASATTGSAMSTARLN